jgi:hypothetical protein
MRRGQLSRTSPAHRTDVRARRPTARRISLIFRGRGLDRFVQTRRDVTKRPTESHTKEPAMSPIFRALSILTLAACGGLAACGDEPSATPDDASGVAGTSGGAGTSGAAGTGAPDGGAAGSGNASSQRLSFTKDGAPVAVDFGEWGTPAYYQETVAGWTLAVVANEVFGTQKRYFALNLRATDGNELALGTYPCAPDAAGPKVKGQLTWAEEGMARVWKQAADAPCSITITELGALGARLKGTFSATLTPTQGATANAVLADGVFDVVRKEY